MVFSISIKVQYDIFVHDIFSSNEKIRFNMTAKIREIQHFSEALHFWEKLPVDECVFVFILHRNSRWPPKMARKPLLGKVPVNSAYPAGQKFH